MKLFLLVFCLAVPLLGRAQLSSDSVFIAEVNVKGQKKTRPWVIFREMTFRRGDLIPRQQFETEVAMSYNSLMNTGLFASVDIHYDSTTIDHGFAIVNLDIRETWYIYPVPLFELADRNFNVWWRDQNRALDRVNIGLRLSYYNFTGRRDRLKLGATTGYTRSYNAGYRFPYINRAGSLGLEFNYDYVRRREQNYLTVDNQQEFYSEEDDFVYRSTNFWVSLTYRRQLYVSHSFELGWKRSSISDTIANKLNPAFFGGGRSSQAFLRSVYTFRNDRRDVRNYPWQGSFLELIAAKDGLGITGERSGLELGATYRKFIPFGRNYSLNLGLAAKYSLIRTQQPFLENRAIGFGNNGLVGYQFYVVDGLDMFIWRVGIRKELFRSRLDLGKLVFIDAFRYIPIRLLLAVQFNQGITNSPFAEATNRLNNTWLTGVSAGLDVVLFYDMVGSVQYNHNHLGEDGVYLSLNLNF